MDFVYPAGATPLDLDLLADLIPDITKQAELNGLENASILDAKRLAQRSRRLKSNLLSPEGLCLLHRLMLDQIWRWAGQYRTRNTNIGVDWYQVPVEVVKLCDDTKYQIGCSVYSWDELAVRFHHRLVAIHPFPNGNGRHARLAADLLLRFHGQKELTWGGGHSLTVDSAVRNAYLKALRQADLGDYTDLLVFCRM